jgi:hypothetical protein
MEKGCDLDNGHIGQRKRKENSRLAPFFSLEQDMLYYEEYDEIKVLFLMLPK